MTNIPMTAQMFPTTDPNMQQKMLDMYRQQLMAQQLTDNGQLPQATGMNGYVAKHTPLELAVRGLSAYEGNQSSLNAQQAALQLQGEQFQNAQQQYQQAQGGNGAQSTSGGSAPSTGIGAVNPATSIYARVLDPTGAANADYIKSKLVGTPDMQNAAASGVNSPLAYATATTAAQEKAKAPYAAPISVPQSDGTSKTMSPVLFNQTQGVTPQGNGQPPAPMAPVSTSASLPPNLPVAQGNIGQTPAQILNGAPPNQAIMPQIGANSLSGAIPIPGFKDPVSSPQGASSVPEAPAPQPPAAAVPPVLGVTQNPAAAKGAETEVTNYMANKQGNAQRALEGQQAMNIINQQETLMKNFTPGTFETHRAEVAAGLKSLGAPDSIVNGIANGGMDAAAAVQAFDGLASQHALLQARSLASGNGNSSPRISQTEFQNFKEDLSNPDKQAFAIRSINDLTRQQYQDSLSELQARAAYEKTGQPLGNFENVYRNQMGQKINQTFDQNRATQNVPQPITKTIGNTTYIQQNGKWYQQ